MTYETALALALAFGSPTPKNVPPAQPAVMKYATKTITTTRAPQGHTHSHCGVSWDHVERAGHNCPICGALVLVQDRVPRPVTVTRQVRVPVDEAPRVAPVVAPRPPASIPAVRQYMQSGCVNGQCGTYHR